MGFKSTPHGASGSGGTLRTSSGQDPYQMGVQNPKQQKQQKQYKQQKTQTNASKTTNATKATQTTNFLKQHKTSKTKNIKHTQPGGCYLFVYLDFPYAARARIVLPYGTVKLCEPSCVNEQNKNKQTK